MTKKLMATALISLLLPVFSLASEPATVTKIDSQNDLATTTEATKKDLKKEELKKQLTDTINIYSAIVNSLQRLSQRVSDRVDILAVQNSLSDDSKSKIDTKRATLDSKLDSLNDKINGALTKSAEILAESSKPAKPLRDFKKEAIKIKTDIISAHKLVLEIIDLVKKESLKSEIKTDTDSQNLEASSTDQTN